jgi:hypothetical protein
LSMLVKNSTCHWTILSALNYNFFFFFFAVLGFEFTRASHFLGRASALKPHLQSFLLLLFWRVLHFFPPDQPWSRSSYFNSPTIAGMTGSHHLFLLRKDRLGTVILPNSASKVDMVIGMSHCPPPPTTTSWLV